MDLIRQNKKDIPDSGQIIYSELAVSEFPKLKEYLVQEVGYKPEEIGIITGATNKNQRIAIQNDFNAGKIKVVIGSEAIQEGMNLQENTTDIYMLSLPYNFTSLRQVEGRAWRQGNKNDNVRINFMLTNDSIDVFMLQKLQAKQARYLEAMKKGADVLDISDISTQELKTSIITNPETRANIEIELIKKRIENEKNKHLADSAFVLRKYDDYLKGKIRRSELAAKGVNVADIDKQTKTTNEKIAELDKKLQELPEVREALVVKFKMEKEELLKAKADKDFVKERGTENMQLFNTEKMMTIPKNVESNNLKKPIDSTNQEQMYYSARRR